MNKNINRRSFLQFLSLSGATVGALGSFGIFQGCIPFLNKSTWQPIKPSSDDDLILAGGLSYKILIKMNDSINQTEKFGDNNDYTAIIPIDEANAYLWINHEYTNPMFVGGMLNTKNAAIEQMQAVGGSLLHLEKKHSSWSIKFDSKINRRITAQTPIKFSMDQKIKGQNFSMGTNSNCAGGITPYGTFLTCEENYQNCWGERKIGEKIDFSETEYHWHEYFESIPEHFGWVVEINPKTGDLKKHTSMGRFSHESATVVRAKNSKLVVYSGDDKQNECLYKFISQSSNSLDVGILYVASLEKKKWLPLDLNLSPELKKYFTSQIDVLTHARVAANILGGTKLDRPEDIEIDPITGNVFISLTNNKSTKNFHGSILKIQETNDYDSLTFEHENFATGGKLGEFSCPDNLAFDKNGNLWIATDISGSSLNISPYEQFKNNGLFVIPRAGERAGKILQIASAPKEAEFTGISFTPDNSSLIVSVQHPGEYTKDITKPHSHWPNKNDIPRSAVVLISGPTLDQIIG